MNMMKKETIVVRRFPRYGAILYLITSAVPPSASPLEGFISLRNSPTTDSISAARYVRHQEVGSSRLCRRPHFPGFLPQLDGEGVARL